MRWKDLLWTIQSPPETAAWLDWATGIVHINATRAEFDAAQAEATAGGIQHLGTSPRWQLLDRSLTHEHVHFLQCITTGYMYQWTSDYFRLLARGTTDLGYPFPDFDTARTALLGAEQRLSPDTLNMLRRHTAKLDSPGPHGLTIRHLLEGHAFCVEQRTHVEPMNADTLLHLLNISSPSMDYRIAYDLARFWVGHDRAFQLFPALAVASLCTTAPPETFLRILRAMCEPNRATRDALDLTDTGDNRATADSAHVLKALNDVAADLLMGSAAEVLAQDRNEHPIYGPAVRQLNELADQGGQFSMQEFMSNPEGVLAILIDDLIRPTLFRPVDDDAFPLQMPKRIGSGHEAETEMQVLLLISALSNRIYQVATPDAWAETGLPAKKALSWLCDFDPRLRVFEISTDWLDQPESETLTSIMDPYLKSTENRHETAALWGGCMLTFQIDNDDVAPRHPSVRRFVRTVHDRMPYFPIYLNFAPELPMFFFWFGALADADAWHGFNTFDIRHHSVVLEVCNAILTMRQVGLVLGLDVGPQVERLLQPYPADDAERLLAALD